MVEVSVNERSNMSTDLLGKEVKVIDAEGVGNNYKEVGRHDGIIRAIYFDGKGNFKFLVQEREGRLIVRLPYEIRVPWR